MCVLPLKVYTVVEQGGQTPIKANGLGCSASRTASRLLTELIQEANNFQKCKKWQKHTIWTFVQHSSVTLRHLSLVNKPSISDRLSCEARNFEGLSYLFLAKHSSQITLLR